MPFVKENVGYTQMTDEKSATLFLKHLVNNATDAFKGYKYLYLRHEFGNIETNFTVDVNQDINALNIKGINIQCSNMVAWDLTVEAVLDGDYDDYFTVLFSDRNGKACAVGTIVCPDVLPYIRADMSLSAQVAGFPLEVSLFKSEEEFVNLQSGEKKYNIADGHCLPLNLLFDDKKEGGTANELNYVKGRVKKFRSLYQNIVMVVVDTQFGELPLYFDKKLCEVEDICIGDWIVCNTIISLDVAVFDYQKALYDEQSIYELFQDAVMQSGGDRLWQVLSEDCKYYSEWAPEDKKSFIGKKAICDRMTEVNNCRKQRKDLSIASRICKIEQIKNDEKDHKFAVGQKSLLFTNNIYDGWGCAFILKIENEKITEIYVTTDSDYQFDVETEFSQKNYFERKEDEIVEIFSSKNDVITKIENFIEKTKKEDKDDISNLVFKVAAKLGEKEYIKYHIEKNGLSGDIITYLHVAQDDEIV